MQRSSMAEMIAAVTGISQTLLVYYTQIVQPAIS